MYKWRGEGQRGCRRQFVVVLPTECSTRVQPLAFAALSAPFSRRFLFPLEAQINYYHGRPDSTVLQPAVAATKAIVADTDAAVRPLFDPHRSTSNNESVYFLFNLRGDSSPADQVSGGRWFHYDVLFFVATALLVFFKWKSVREKCIL